MLTISRDDISSTKIQQFPGKTRFMKVPIEKYLNILPGYKPNSLGFDPIPPQMALINALNNPKYRFVVAALSRRTGKTEMSNIIAQLVSFIPNSNVLIIAPDYTRSFISWDLQKKLLKNFEINLVRSNAKDKIMELENNSTIRIASVNKADSAVGRSYDFILFDEAALENKGKEAFNISLRPTLDKENSKCVFISTPRGDNWFKEFYNRGFSDRFPMWVSIHSDWTDNPRASTADIEEAKRGMSKSEFRQEYYADFVSVQGQIYSLDPKQITVLDIEKIRRVDVIAGLDLGFRDHTAFIVMITDGKNYYIVDEYVATGKTTEIHAAKMREMINDWGIDFIYIDSSAAQTKFDLAMSYDISTINAKKSILDGIGYVASLVDNNRVFVDSSCTNSIEMFNNYVWDPRAGLIEEKPLHNLYSHAGDAVRYAMYSHSHNMDDLWN